MRTEAPLVSWLSVLDLPHALIEWVTMPIITREGDRRCGIPPHRRALVALAHLNCHDILAHIVAVLGMPAATMGQSLAGKRVEPVYQPGADVQTAEVTRVPTRDDRLVLHICSVSECTSGDLLCRFTRRTGSALTAVALITGMASAARNR